MEGGYIVAGGEGIRLPKMLSAVELHVEQMHFPMTGKLFAVRAKHKTGIVNPSILRFGETSAHQTDVVFPGAAGKGLPDGTTGRLGIIGKVLCGIGAAEHFGQDHQRCAILGGFPDGFAGQIQVFLLIKVYRGLQKRNFHACAPGYLPRHTTLR